MRNITSMASNAETQNNTNDKQQIVVPIERGSITMLIRRIEIDNNKNHTSEEQNGKDKDKALYEEERNNCMKIRKYKD